MCASSPEGTRVPLVRASCRKCFFCATIYRQVDFTTLIARFEYSKGSQGPRGKRIRATCAPISHLFFVLLLLLFPVLQPPRISCAMIRVIRYIRLNFVSSIRKGIGEFFDAGLEDLIYYYLNC